MLAALLLFGGYVFPRFLRPAPKSAKLQLVTIPKKGTSVSKEMLTHIGILEGTPVCVAPTARLFVNRGLRDGETFFGKGFEVVAASGLYLTTADLRRMHLTTSDPIEVRNFCEGHVSRIYETHFPAGLRDMHFLPGCCHVDEHGMVRITFNVSGTV